MSAEQRVTDEQVAAALRRCGLFGYGKGMEDLLLDLRDERTAHRATEAKLTAALAEVERLKHAQGVLLYARTNERERATTAESALTTKETTDAK